MTPTTRVFAATPPGYRFVEKARVRVGSLSKTNHRGICVFMRSHFIVCTIPQPSYDTVEVLLLTIHYGACNEAVTNYLDSGYPVDDT